MKTKRDPNYEISEERKHAYEMCCRRVLHHYRPSEARGLRRATEKLVAVTIAWEADAEGFLPPLDNEYLADRSRVSLRTFRRYLAVLFDIGWLVEYTRGRETCVRIDPVWMQNLPPPAAQGTCG